MRAALSIVFVCLAAVGCSRPSPRSSPAAPGAPAALTAAAVDAIAQLVMLEDTRAFDEAVLSALTQSSQPEIRRRAVMAVARIVNPRGSGLLMPLRGDRDPEALGAVVFAYGQLKDTSAVDWLAARLQDAATPDSISIEAARSLGKIRSPEARAALVQYLEGAPAARTGPVGEALLAYGRFAPPSSVTPIARWTTHADPEVRWRAAWALFRLREAAAAPYLLTLSFDKSADVRFWAVRGLTPALAAGLTMTHPAAGVSIATPAARLRALVKDPDRRVRTEALRALVQHDDPESLHVVLSALESPDAWMSVSAAEGLARMKDRAALVVPRLVAAMAASQSTALRITALAPLSALAPDAAVEAAAALVLERSLVAPAAAIQALGRLGRAGQQRLAALSADPATKELIAQATPVRGARAEPITRTAAEYRQIVERWIVPAYKGAPKPRVILGTPRGEIEIELHAGEAPLGLEYLVRVVESGEIVGTEFGRVVPNFVAQQRAIRNDVVLRDEVNRLGLTRGNLSWASSGLDTGRPGYTLGSTPQPHNEGDFTALGRVVRGMDVVDRLELGDRITSATMKQRP